MSEQAVLEKVAFIVSNKLLRGYGARDAGAIGACGSAWLSPAAAPCITRESPPALSQWIVCRLPQRAARRVGRAMAQQQPSRYVRLSSGGDRRAGTVRDGRLVPCVRWQGDDGHSADGSGDDDEAGFDGKSEDELPEAEVDALACEYGCMAPSSRYRYGRLDELDQQHLEKVRGGAAGARLAPLRVTHALLYAPSGRRKLRPKGGCSGGGKLGGDASVRKPNATPKRRTSCAG